MKICECHTEQPVLYSLGTALFSRGAVFIRERHTVRSVLQKDPMRAGSRWMYDRV